MKTYAFVFLILLFPEGESSSTGHPSCNNFYFGFRDLEKSWETDLGGGPMDRTTASPREKRPVIPDPRIL